MLRSLPVLTLTAAIVASSAVLAQTPADRPPESIELEGKTRLTRAGRAVRTDLLGLVELYEISLYTNTGTDRARLALEETPKALRIDVRYMPELKPRVRLDWWRELVPTLTAPAQAHLNAAFAAVRKPDVVLIAYAPRRGTSIRVNEGVPVSEGGHDLMIAFFDHWIGQRPVSEEVKRALLAAL
jgi:hypothetical protein